MQYSTIPNHSPLSARTVGPSNVGAVTTIIFPYETCESTGRSKQTDGQYLRQSASGTKYLQRLRSPHYVSAPQPLTHDITQSDILPKIIVKAVKNNNNKSKNDNILYKYNGRRKLRES